MKTIVNGIIRGFVLVALFLSGVSAYAQTKVSGTIKDAKGDPIIGAVVIVDGYSSVGSATDANGKYTLVIPSNVKQPTLVASCIGFAEKKAIVGKNVVIDFTLEEDSQTLDEVVVVGYGSMRKSDLTGSVTSVKIEEGDASRSSSISDLLQGRAAGVQVLNAGGAPDAGVSIRIRGLSSFSGSTEPLYVVDGIIINGNSGSESMLSKGGMDNQDGDEATNGLLGLNPQDIASMEILKDASATAIYGALGANGVVLITTKSAKREKPVVNFNAGVDVSTVYKKMDILNFDEYSHYLQDKYLLGKEAIGSAATNAERYLSRMYEDINNLEGLKVRPMDWQDQALRTAISQRYYFSISGRPKTLSYNFSLGFQDKQGIIKDTGVKIYTARLNLDKTVGKKFKFGTKTSFSYVDSDMTQGTAGGRMTANTSLVRSMTSFIPYFVDRDEDVDYDVEDEFRASPEKWLAKENFFNSRKEFRVTPSIYAQYQIVPWLNFKSTLGGDYRNTDRQKFKSAMINSTPEANNGAASVAEYMRWNWDNTFNFNKKFAGAHAVQATLGQSVTSSLNTMQTVEGWNIDQYKGGIECLNGAPNTRRSYSESQNQTMSFFVRGIYNFKDRYVLTATYRLDGSSKFKGSNKWASFPSMAFAWRLNQEPWFKVPVISMAKFRLGWGRVGNQSVANYQTMSNFGSGAYPAHNLGNNAETIITLAPSNLANPNLKWETTEQFNGGIDFGMWKGRLTLTADAYYKTTFDLLQSKAVPASSGFTTIAFNEGVILNKGVELAVSAVPVKTRDFEWTIDGNISFNRNQIRTISESSAKKAIWVSTTEQKEVVYFEGSNIGSSNYIYQTANIFMEGYPMGLFYGYKVKGIVPEGGSGLPLSNGGDPGKPGQLDYYDLNNNGYQDLDDRTIVGDPNPDFTYGFSTSLTWKGLTLYANFIGSQGNDILNFNSACETYTGDNNRNVFREAYYNAWTPQNTNTKYAALGLLRGQDVKIFSDYFVEDGSYLRLQTLSLSYNVPIKKNAKILKGLNVGASANNLFIWTKYRGWDPDVNSSGTNIKKMGLDQGSYPSCRAFSVDLKFRF